MDGNLGTGDTSSMKTNMGFGLRVVILCVAAAGMLLPSTAKAAAKDACSLVSTGDAQSALGEPVSAGQSFPEGDGSRCRFRSTVGSALKAKTLAVSVHYSDASGTAAAIADNLKNSGFPDAHQVAGIGNAAVWATSNNLGRLQGELTVIKGKTAMLVILISNPTDENAALNAAKTLAAKLLPQL